MTWNHRVVRYSVDGETYYQFAEVFYNDDGTRMGWSNCHMVADDVGELTLLVGRLAKALAMGVLDVPVEPPGEEYADV